MTKLSIPPSRAKVLQRPRLMDLLNQSRSVPLTLLSASAGFGKSTLLATWATHSLSHVGWFALEEQDNDLMRFWLYVIAALRKAGAPVGAQTEELLQAAQPALLTGALISLINELASFGQDIVLILDDYHLIRDQAIHDALVFVLEHLPPNLHVLLSSRADPPLPLARLRARGLLLEIREAELRLCQEETAQFLGQVMDVALKEDEIELLEARTEGWITGLQLAALALRRHTDVAAFLQSFTGSHRFLLDYIQEEILDPLPEERQRFLLHTAILTKLNAEVCQALTGEADSQRILEELERANLFLLPLDEERRWYRFHTLFREVLLARLQATQPEQVACLHREAALWHLRQGWLREAIPHALATHDYLWVADILEKSIERLALQGELKTLLTWLKQLPIEVLRAHPRLATTYLLLFNLLFPFAQQERAEDAHLQQIREGVAAVLQHPAQAQLSEAEQERLHQRMVILAVWQQAKQALSDGDMAQLQTVVEQTKMPEWHDDALWQQHGLAPFAIAWRMAGNFPPLVAVIQPLRQQARQARERAQEFHVLWGLIAAQIALGQLRAADANLQDLQHLSDSLGDPLPLAAYSDLFRAQLAYEWNQLDVAHAAALQAIRRTAPARYMDILMGAYDVLVRTRIASGALLAAEQAWNEMEQAQQAAAIPLFQPWIEGLHARLWLAQGNLGQAANWAAHTPYLHEALAGGIYSREGTSLAVARVLLAQRDTTQACELLAALLTSAEHVARVGSVISILALQVAAFHEDGAVSDAQRILSRLLTLAQPEGSIRAFLDVGDPMRQELRAWLATSQESATPELVAYARAIVHAFSHSPQKMAMDASASPVTAPSSASPLIEPLSQREQEVLHLLAEGMSNQDIAHRLVISLTTVKKHVASIFLKLAAENRTHAVARARELSLL